MGAGTAAAIVAELAAGRVDKDISEDEIKQLLAAGIAKRLAPYAVPLFVPPPLGGRLGGGRYEGMLSQISPHPASPYGGGDRLVTFPYIFYSIVRKVWQ